VLYPDEGLLSSKPKRWCCFYVVCIKFDFVQACGSGYQIITPEEQLNDPGYKNPIDDGNNVAEKWKRQICNKFIWKNDYDI